MYVVLCCVRVLYCMCESGVCVLWEWNVCVCCAVLCVRVLYCMCESGVCVLWEWSMCV